MTARTDDESRFKAGRYLGRRLRGTPIHSEPTSLRELTFDDGSALESWKAIAAYLNRTVRTVQRWEREQGLPVHRLVHNKLGSVYANRLELDDWVHARLTTPAQAVPDHGAVVSTLNADRSIAILPFRNLTNSEAAGYLCDGIVDGLISALSRVPHLRVPSRTATYAAAIGANNAIEVGLRLGTETVLDSELSYDAGWVRVNASLIDAGSLRVLWTREFDSGEGQLTEIQEQIAQGTVKALGMTGLEGVHLAREHSTNLGAQRLYLMSLAQWNLQTIDGITQAIELARLAIKRDRDYALAHTMLALALMTLATYVPESPASLMEAARQASTDALLIDPEIAAARGVLGVVHMAYDFDWPAAAAQYRAAITLNPNEPSTYLFISLLNVAARKGSLAQKTSRTAERLEPANPLWAAHTAWVLYFDRQHEAALEQLQPVIHRHPEFFRAYTNSAWALIAAGRFAEGLAMAEMAAALNPRYPTARAVLAHALAAAGNVSSAQQLIDAIKADGAYASHYYLSIALAALGDKDASFEALWSAVRNREWFVILLQSDPALDTLRSDERYDALVKHLGLPATSFVDS